jgi:hypothetical protein
MREGMCLTRVRAVPCRAVNGKPAIAHGSRVKVRMQAPQASGTHTHTPIHTRARPYTHAYGYTFADDFMSRCVRSASAARGLLAAGGLACSTA